MQFAALCMCTGRGLAVFAAAAEPSALSSSTVAGVVIFHAVEVFGRRVDSLCRDQLVDINCWVY